MRAAILNAYGPPEQLSVENVDRPSVAKNHLLVYVVASPVTQGDRRMRASDFPGVTWLLGRLMVGLFRPRHPIVGTVFAGRVVEVGSEVCSYRVGDNVFGHVDHGAHAEYLSVAEDGAVAKIPPGVDYVDAAAIPFGAQTAMHYVRDLAQVSAGDRVAVVGAAGEVGRFAVQIAKQCGAEVTGVCRGSSVELVRSLGADHVVDFTQHDFTQLGAVYDVIFDTADALRSRSWRACIAPGGIYLTLGLRLELLVDWMRHRVFGGPRVGLGVSLPTAAQVAELADWMSQGKLKPTIREPLPLGRIADAHRQLEARAGDGTVLVVNPTGKARISAS